MPRRKAEKDVEDEAFNLLLADSGPEDALPRPAPRPPAAGVRDMPPRPVTPSPPPMGPPPGKKAADLWKPRARPDAPERGWSLPAVNPQIVLGVLMMLGAVAWFVAGLAVNTIFFYPPVLFFLGIGAVIRGFRGGD